jgi:ABC-2 type transport system ATP-binding protein/lipopolysaccharide transport system ATP-binding protein
MYVRLGFAVAVNVDPEILLVDEVIAVGDEEFQRRCMNHMNQLREKGTTIVLVSHNATLMSELCDRVGWLDHGRLLALGEASEVVHKYLAHVNSGGDNTLTTRD